MARRNLSKRRSHRTYQSRLRKITKYYQTLFNRSKENYKQNEEKGYKKPDSSYFFMNYPTEKSFLKKIQLKVSNTKVK